MKVSLLLAGLIWPALAFGQQMYTNADLEKFEVPGAYTNQDLRRLPPLPVQKEAVSKFPAYVPAEPSPETIARFENRYYGLKHGRDALAFELDYELKRIEFSESAFAGDPAAVGQPRLGYRTVGPLVMELRKRIALFEHEMETVAFDARRAGVLIDQR